MKEKDQATVRDVFNMMKRCIAQGRGDYVVTCNEEYILAKKGDKPVIYEDQKTADLGGYDY